MKRFWKIVAWFFTTLIGVVTLVIAIAVYIVFTPERLTPIVRSVVGKYVTCGVDVERVELTFFSTFPRLTVQIDGVVLTNPVEGAPSDTILDAPHVHATIDLKQLLFENNLVLSEVALDEASVSYFVAQDGTSNFDIFPPATDTISEPDTTAFSLPFDQLQVEGVRVQARAIRYEDQTNDIRATLGPTELTANADNWNDIVFHLDANDMTAQLGQETYASHAHVTLDAPLTMYLDSMRFCLHNVAVTYNEFAFSLDGDVDLSDSIAMDMRLTTIRPWDIETLIATVPSAWVEPIQTYRPKGNMLLAARVQGAIADRQLPVVFIDTLNANLWHSRFGIRGQVTDIATEMAVNMHVDMDLQPTDFKPFMPDEMELNGKLHGALDATVRMSEVELGVFSQANLSLVSHQLHMRLDTTLEAELSNATMHVKGSNLFASNAFYNMDIVGDYMDVRYDTIQADLNDPQIDIALVAGKKCKIALNTTDLNARMGEFSTAKADSVQLHLAAKYNPTESHFLLQWNPLVDVKLAQGEFHLPDILPDILYTPSLDIHYSNSNMTIHQSTIELGYSDMMLDGYIQHIGGWIRKEQDLIGSLDITSRHCDANQLLVWLSADEGSEETPASDSIVVNTETQTSSADSVSDQQEPSPFLVPTDVDIALRTHLQEVDFSNQRATNLKGGIYIHDGNLILEELGFACRAAKMQLSALYRTPRKNHIYVGFDYHMIDVNISELLTIVPGLKNMVPMLDAFEGNADFHLAAETYTKADYTPKMSTLRGAMSLTATDLVVLDSETFDQIAKMLLFSKKTVNKIDSINAEITLYKNQIDVYPLCVQMDNYMVALGGRHNTDMTFNYDINVLKPIYLGLNVSGKPNDLQFKLVKCKFAQDFRPHWYQKVDNQSRELRERIKQSMEKNVKIK